MIKNLFTLYSIFFRVGCFTFGGGYAMLPMLEKELVDVRKWTTRDELMDFYAVGQSTPGIISVNVATFVGYKQGGILGGIASTLGIVTPSIIVICIVATALSKFSHVPAVRNALAGINVAVSALITKAFATFFSRSVKSVAALIIFAAAFVALFYFNVSTVIVTIISAAVGLVVRFVREKIAKKGGPHE